MFSPKCALSPLDAGTHALRVSIPHRHHFGCHHDPQKKSVQKHILIPRSVRDLRVGPAPQTPYIHVVCMQLCLPAGFRNLRCAKTDIASFRINRGPISEVFLLTFCLLASQKKYMKHKFFYWVKQFAFCVHPVKHAVRRSVSDWRGRPGRAAEEISRKNWWHRSETRSLMARTVGR